MSSNNDIHVFKPANSPYYHCRTSVGGVRRSRSTKCRNERDALAWALRWKKNLVKLAEEKAAAPAAGMTFIQAVDRFMEEVGDGFYRPDRHRMFFDWLVDRIGEDTPLSEITNSTVSALVAERSKEFRFNDPKWGYVSRAYVGVAVVNPLSSVFTRARTIWDVPLPREPRWSQHRISTKGRKRTMTFAEEEAILAVAGGMAPVIEFDLLTALRRRDLLIRWSNVDWDANVIRVVTKGDKEHEIRITDGIRKLLDEARGKHPVFVWTVTPEAGEHKGACVPLTYEMVLPHFKKACGRAGVRGLTVHDLRRTAGERMYRATGDIGAASNFLGHASIELTRRHYVHIKLDDVEERQIAMEFARAKILAERAKKAESERDTRSNDPTP